MSCYQKKKFLGKFLTTFSWQVITVNFNVINILVQIYCYAVARLVTELSLLLTWYLE